MRYLALLRGINVGGRNKVEMSRLKALFESVGSTDVRTYINSGNVVFDHRRTRARLLGAIEEAFEAEFGLPAEILLRDRAEVEALAAGIPEAWQEDTTMRCYVLFLWGHVDAPTVLDSLRIREGIDDVRYLPGAVVWRVDRAVLTRSGMMRLPGTDLYRSMTIRNVNTVRRLATMMAEA